MRGSGHHATGFLSGFIAASISYKFFGAPMAISFIAVPFSWWGGVFPDSSEFFLGIRWVKHRTVTHWVPLWLALIATAMLYPFGDSITASTSQASLLGFGFGGLTHLIFDWPNPRGIPFLTPWRSHSLGLWKSGRREVYIVLTWAILSALPWLPEIQYLFDGYDRLASAPIDISSIKRWAVKDVNF